MGIGDNFGGALAVNGYLIVVKSPSEAGRLGDPDNWGEVTIVRADDLQPDDQFGLSLDLFKDTLGGWCTL